MGWADRIGGGPPTVGALVAARNTRLVQAQEFIRDHWPDGTPDDSAALFQRIAVWVESGGPPPWDPPAPDVEGGPQPYPPR